jgi:hypothetical protein
MPTDDDRTNVYLSDAAFVRAVQQIARRVVVDVQTQEIERFTQSIADRVAQDRAGPPDTDVDDKSGEDDDGNEK